MFVVGVASSFLPFIPVSVYTFADKYQPAQEFHKQAACGAASPSLPVTFFGLTSPAGIIERAQGQLRYLPSRLLPKPAEFLDQHLWVFSSGIASAKNSEGSPLILEKSARKT